MDLLLTSLPGQFQDTHSPDKLRDHDIVAEILKVAIPSPPSPPNSRDFYRYINSQKEYNQGILPLKRRGGTGITASEIEQAEEFNGQFTDVFNQSDHSEVAFRSRSAHFMDDIVVSNEVVTKLLKGQNPSKALGPEELHPRVLKELATEFGPVFAHLFQQSLDTGEIPKEWSLYVSSIKRVPGLLHVIIVPSH